MSVKNIFVIASTLALTGNSFAYIDSSTKFTSKNIRLNKIGNEIHILNDLGVDRSEVEGAFKKYGCNINAIDSIPKPLEELTNSLTPKIRLNAPQSINIEGFTGSAFPYGAGSIGNDNTNNLPTKKEDVFANFTDIKTKKYGYENINDIDMPTECADAIMLNDSINSGDFNFQSYKKMRKDTLDMYGAKNPDYYSFGEAEVKFGGSLLVGLIVGATLSPIGGVVLGIVTFTVLHETGNPDQEALLNNERKRADYWKAKVDEFKEKYESNNSPKPTAESNDTKDEENKGTATWKDEADFMKPANMPKEQDTPNDQNTTNNQDTSGDQNTPSGPNTPAENPNLASNDTDKPDKDDTTTTYSDNPEFLEKVQQEFEEFKATAKKTEYLTCNGIKNDTNHDRANEHEMDKRPKCDQAGLRKELQKISPVDCHEGTRDKPKGSCYEERVKYKRKKTEDIQRKVNKVNAKFEKCIELNNTRTYQVDCVEQRNKDLEKEKVTQNDINFANKNGLVDNYGKLAVFYSLLKPDEKSKIKKVDEIVEIYIKKALERMNDSSKNPYDGNKPPKFEFPFDLE